MTESKNSNQSSKMSLIEGAGWLLFVIFAFIYTFQFDDPLPVYDLGPAFWPRIVLAIMFIAAVGMLYPIVRHYRGSSSRMDQTTTNQDDVLERSMQIRIALLFILPIFYTYLIHKMGFLLVTPFFLCGYMWLMGVRRWSTLAIMTVSIYAAIVLVFVKLIFTYLPTGLAFF